MTTTITSRPSRRDNGRHLSPFSYEEATTLFDLDPSRDLKSTRMVSLSVDTTPGAPSLEEQRRARCEQLRRYFHVTMELYEKIFEHLASDEAYTVQPVHRLRHPMVFYLGHTATFFINKLVVAGLTQRINPEFEEMFATGVDEMSWDDLNDAHYSWPPVEEVWHYRSRVRIQVDRMFDSYLESGTAEGMPLPLTFANSTSDRAYAFFWAVLMGIEHERIHVETASVHLRELPLEHVVQQSEFWAPYPQEQPQDRDGHGNGIEHTAPRNEMVPVLRDTLDVPVGRAPDSAWYGWDCDYGAAGFTMPCEPFAASRFLVSNAEFYEFMRDGGYQDAQWWDDEGWAWVSWKQPRHPWFWVAPSSEDETVTITTPSDDKTVTAPAYRLRVMVDEIPLPWDWPAEVNHLEAVAFCNWKAAKTGRRLRLPTEREWLVMWDRFVEVDQGDWHEAPPGNINFDHQWASSCPVDRFAHGPLYDVVGNVWQHLATPTYPYPGYRVHPLYDDFSMPTFDGRHMMMRGGTWISTGNEASRDARFAFRRHFFQYIGIRYVEGGAVDEQALLGSVLGLDPMVDAAAQKAFLRVDDSVLPEHHGSKAARIALAAYAQAMGVPGAVPARALEIQCGAGRITFELGRQVPEAIGTDFTARHLQPAFSMRERGIAELSVVTDAVTGERKAVTARAGDFDWGPTRENAFFYQSDPANLHAHLRDFDLIVGFDALSHSYRPEVVPSHALSRLSATRGGVLVLFEPPDAGISRGPEDALADDQAQRRPSSAEICAALRAQGATVLPVREESFHLADGLVTGDRVGIRRVTLDVIVAVKT